MPGKDAKTYNNYHALIVINAKEHCKKKPLCPVVRYMILVGDVDMAIRNLTNWNDPKFRKRSRPVEQYDERLWTLLDDMRDTLVKVSGYGCAAVHVGVLRRAVVILGKDGVIELVNPEITETSTETQNVLEGSIAPDSPRGYVTRSKNITVAAFDRNGKPITISGEDFLAATFCHEIDHLDGIMFIDKVHPGKAGAAQAAGHPASFAKQNERANKTDDNS